VNRDLEGLRGKNAKSIVSYKKKFFMKEMIIKVPDESVAFVEEFVEKIGGDVSQIKTKTSAKNKKTEIKETKKTKAT